MANVRNKSMRKYQFWLGPTHQEMLNTICEKEGLTKSNTIRELLALYYKSKGLLLVNEKEEETKQTKTKQK